ncbi:MAG: SSI family serine proteinase inhibitor [Gaiellaceae bacterium]
MRVVLLLAILAAVLGSGASAASAASSELRITYWSEGRTQGTARAWTLRCGPVGGTLPRPGGACQKLAGMRSPFAPVPRDAVCTQQYGGPQEALVQGVYRGGRIWARLTLRDGCQIARFKRLAFLVPTFSAGASS